MKLMTQVAHICLHRDQPQLDSRSDAYIEQAQELVINENILLQVNKELLQIILWLFWLQI